MRDAKANFISFNKEGNDNICLGGLGRSNEQQYSDFWCILGIAGDEGKETLQEMKNRKLGDQCQPPEEIMKNALARKELIDNYVV